MQSREESIERIKGLFNITITAFDQNGDVDFKALSENVERVIDLGYDGLLIGGTYGEFATMSADERANVFKAVMEQVGDRVPVLLCSAHSDSRVVFELTKLAGDLGGLPMVTAPYVSEVEDYHIHDFFTRVAPLSKTGIMIYNAPGIGITLSPKLICQLAEIDGMVALKQGDLNPTAVDILSGNLHGKIKMLAASDLALLGPLALGFDGVSSTNSCALPELIHAIFHAIRSGDAQEAGRLQRLWYPLRVLARKYGQPQTTKAIMNMRGFNGGSVRLPLLDLNETQKAELKETLEKVASDPDARITLA
ncbi:dihydrodipicolinate synthase family protein [Roseibium sp. SCP14]|uniref:dihydrodipicolinate synthase family protein n=1 Tax=Roseibium sp. SCP14 TaxID=3141375 RepID=UPI0033359AB9